MRNNLLEVRNLTVQYKTDLETVHAVNDISFSIRPRETLGLVGETGAGKTTTALSILRLLPYPVGQITSGEIIFDGQNLLEAKEGDMRLIRGERISMIFQDPMTSLNPVMTVGDQIKEAIVLHNSEHLSKEEIERRVEQALELVGISKERKKEYPHQFSGGMKQRVVIAIALACKPEILIADEPTTALDVTIQAQVLNLIGDLKEKMEMSVIMITHDLGVIAQTCDSIAVMYAGEIIEYGTVWDIFAATRRHPYTDGLFGSIPNMEEWTERLSPIEGLPPDPTNLPQGCSFAPRCKQCMEICKHKKPAAYQDGTHYIKCFLCSEGVEK